MSFKDYVNKKETKEEEVNEAIKEKTLRDVDDMFETLDTVTNPKGVLATSFVKELGKGFKSDFDELNKKIADAFGFWEEIEYQWRITQD